MRQFFKLMLLFGFICFAQQNIYAQETEEEIVYQIKMYYNGKVMWTRYVPNDSVEWFGYGSYETTDSTLTEKLEYMSASMHKITNPDMIWSMELKLEKNSFSQIFTDEEGNKINSENYKRLD